MCARTCVCRCMLVCVCVRVCPCVSVSVCVRPCVSLRVSVSMCVCVCVSVRVCVVVVVDRLPGLGPRSTKSVVSGRREVRVGMVREDHLGRLLSKFRNQRVKVEGEVGGRGICLSPGSVRVRHVWGRDVCPVMYTLGGRTCTHRQPVPEWPNGRTGEPGPRGARGNYGPCGTSVSQHGTRGSGTVHGSTYTCGGDHTGVFPPPEIPSHLSPEWDRGNPGTSGNDGPRGTPLLYSSVRDHGTVSHRGSTKVCDWNRGNSGPPGTRGLSGPGPSRCLWMFVFQCPLSTETVSPYPLSSV